MTTRLEMVCAIAREGGRLALDMRGRLTRSRKADGSVVTNADVAVQDLLVSKLRDAFPGVGIIAEENDLVSKEGMPAVFAIDPIDGTDSYQLGFPHFGVSIGLIENDRCVLGVFFNPLLDELFAVDAGEPATLNGGIIRAEDSLSAPGAPFLTPSDFHRRFQTDFSGKVRGLGSMAQHLCYVASGQARAALAYRSHIWDLAGGLAILSAAGARVSSFEGEPFHPANHLDGKKIEITLLAAPPKIWKDVHDSISPRKDSS